jgi:N-glycosylase/DNA lyase
MLLNEHIESFVIPLLQHNVQFICNNKVIKKGKLLLFAMKSFYLTFTITNDKGEPKTFEIPYPFKIDTIGDSINLTLDYELILSCQY